jgi:hypothetical protein
VFYLGMPRETFETQAAAVRRILSSGTIVNRLDRQHLACAARNLEALGALRQKVMTMAANSVTELQIDTIAADILSALHIPVPSEPEKPSE